MRAPDRKIKGEGKLENVHDSPSPLFPRGKNHICRKRRCCGDFSVHAMTLLSRLN